MTDLTRRQALHGAALAASATVLPAMPSLAAAPKAASQAPGFYRRRVGEMEVTALLDGYIDVKHAFWTGIDKEVVERAVRDAHLPGNGSIRIGVTSYLVNTGNRLVLIDSGSADFFGPGAGQFLNTLTSAGYKPEQVDVILITHMHPDHIGSLINGTAPVFPNAEMHVCGFDFKYWTSSSEKANAPDFAKPWFDAASAVKVAYEGRMNLFTGGPELTPGITAVPLVGHTPGHTGYRLSSAGEDLLVWGDACGVAAVQFAHPEAGLAFDVDGDKSKQTRARLLDMTASERVLVASAHLPFPSFGHVDRAGGAYAWVPEEYRYVL